MRHKYSRWLIPILLLIIVAAWVVWPDNPGIHIGSLDRQIKVVRGLDLQGGLRVLLEADLPPEAEVRPEQLETARQILEKRVNGLGVTEPVIQIAGSRRILVELPGIGDPQEAVEVIKQTSLLEFIEVPFSDDAQIFALMGSNVRTDHPAGQDIQAEDQQNAGPIFHTVLTGAMLKDAIVTTDELGNPSVYFELTEQGAEIFAAYTSQNVGRYLAIALDKKVISVPRINVPITDGKATITGNFTYEEANNLAIQLRYGALPVPLKVVESKTVGPTLGEDSLQKSAVAGLIGMLVVSLFMALYYRLPGLLAVGALLVYAIVTFALFKLIPVTLTLPGIAGFVLSLGVAVDANVLIFERMKEELRHGRTLQMAIDLGFSRAWPSIRDSNLSTLITCAILYWFGSTFGASIVKGFSLTLALGVIVSLFTAITVTRTFLHLVLDRLSLLEHPRWFGV